ncbi:fused MFS/spermidine synthase [Subtercola sp. PAMC28395]|uniref:spermidine synthase n=1 Tax=Subtercola sp. PAMC28395 TaxID=2846775 RepID=UPI001C0BCBCE|nr:fused MFS/spermidine synthase [Subtercola sp. PAMC28395]QWT24066.1 fused MFS/spermidine synthase [Subtercola sp. PAMC28395]
MTARHSRTLEQSGLLAELVPDTFGASGVTLEIGGEAQSHVYPAAPEEVLYDYVRRIANAADLVAEAHAPIRVLHLGAGALTLARYISATRPGSQQFIIELEPGLVDFVLEHLPLDANDDLTLRVDDARTGLRWAAASAPFDLIVSDVYVGSSTPPHLKTTGFYEELTGLLAPQGVVAVNVADDNGLAAVRSQADAVRRAFSLVAVVGPTALTDQLREGNAVILGSAGQHMLAWLPQLKAAGPHPSGLVRPHELATFIGDAVAATDARG